MLGAVEIFGFELHLGLAESGGKVTPRHGLIRLVSVIQLGLQVGQRRFGFIGHLHQRGPVAGLLRGFRYHQGYGCMLKRTSLPTSGRKGEPEGAELSL
jgi:hypothetical protein